MSHDKVSYHEIEPVAGAMHFLRSPLECEELGFMVVGFALPAGRTLHDHADEGEEEVYLLTEGEATISVEGEDIHLSAGDALRVDPGARRQITNGDADSTFVIAGAP